MTTRPAARSSLPQRRAPDSTRGYGPSCRSPPTPKGLGWVATVGPGVIVLGASIGSGEFLLGPAAFVRHGLSLLWVTAVAVFLQTIFNTEVMRYTLATGEPVVHRLHAHAPVVTALGVGLRRSLLPPGRLAGVGGQRCRRDLLSVRPAARRAGGCHGGLLHRRGDVPHVRGCAPRWSAHRAHARAAQLGARRVHPGRLPGAGRCCSFRRRPGSPRLAGFVRLRRGAAGSSTSSRRGRTSSCSAALVAYSGAAASSNITLVELGAGQGLRHGEAGGLHPRAAAAGRRCISRTAASSSRPMRTPCVGGAGGGASSGPTSGGCSSSAPSSAWCCPRCST